MKNTNTIPLTKSSKALSRKPLSEGHATNFNELYLKKDFKGAAQYLLDNKQRLDSGIFHYNLGTLYSKMGDLATARFHLEKAIQEGYINSASVNNLSFVKSQLQVDDLTSSTSLPDEFVNFATSIPASAYLSITLIFCFILAAMIRFEKIQRKWVMILGALIALSPIIVSNTYIKNINYAVALKDLPLYEGPSKIFNEKGKVRAGSKIILGQFKEGWFYIEFPLSLSGWISKEQLGLY